MQKTDFVSRFQKEASCGLTTPCTKIGVGEHAKFRLSKNNYIEETLPNYKIL